MRIQHNIAALNAYRQLGGNNSAVAGNLEKLSSGYRINRAGDDAAGLAISEKMRAQIKGLETASNNAEDGVSLIQTAEGALTEVHSMLNRMVELATQSANGTYGEQERNKLEDEVTALKDEIDRISDSTNFNGINLLDGSMGSGTTGVKAANAKAGTLEDQADAVDFTISGLEAGKTVTVQLAKDATGADGITADSNGNITVNIKGTAGRVFTQSDMDSLIRNATLPESAKNLSIKLSNDMKITAATANDTKLVDAAKVAEAKNATAEGKALTNTDGVSTKVTVTATTAGANTSTLTVSNTTTSAVGATAQADGGVALNLDANTAYTATQINQMLSKAGAGMTVDYTGALKGSDLLVGDKDGAATYQLGTDGTAGAGLAEGGGLKLQVGDTNDGFQKVSVSVASMSSDSLGLGGVDVSTQEAAGNSIQMIKDAIEKVSTARGNLGALQNRLDHTINNLGVTTENMTAAESRIRDVDMAEEMMTFTKNNILTQASQAMLAQANQLPQGVLQLLQ